MAGHPPAGLQHANGIVDGWLTGATRCQTSHRDERPDPADISLIVLHCISLPPGEFGGDWIDRLFSGCLPATHHPYFATLHGLRVSAHLLIRRDGSLTQYVPFQQRAWHAGVSCYEGRERCNDFSIGIELEGTETLPYQPMQYQVLTATLTTLIQHYPGLSTQRIVGHSDIAPGRKTDPGTGFDWPLLFSQLQNPLSTS